MNDIREHWSGIVAKRNELTERYGDAIYLMSVESKKRKIRGGVITVASPHVAAIMIEDETHREADPDEIERWQRDQERLGRNIRETAAKKDAKVHVNLGDLLSQVNHMNEESNRRAPVIPPLAEANAGNGQTGTQRERI